MKISVADRYIQDHQLDKQETLVDRELLRLDIQVHELSSAAFYRFREELRLIKRSIKETRKELHLIPVRRRTPWDYLKIKLYNWAVRGRIE